MDVDIEKKRRKYSEREDLETDVVIKGIKNFLISIGYTKYNASDFIQSDRETLEKIWDYLHKNFNIKEYKREFESRLEEFFDILFCNSYPPRLAKIKIELAYPYDLINRENRAIVNFLYAPLNPEFSLMESNLLNAIISQSDSNYRHLTVSQIENQLRKFNFNVNEKPIIHIDSDFFPSHMNEEHYEKVEQNYDDVSHKRKRTRDLGMHDFFTYSEYFTYLLENKFLLYFGLEDRVRWVARYDGDSFHYDILSYNPETGREKIIEVKSTNWAAKTFRLSKYELNNMKESDDAECYVYWFRIDFKDEYGNIITDKDLRTEFYILKYIRDDEMGYFVDQNGTKYDMWFDEENKNYQFWKSEDTVMERGKIFSKKYAKMISFK